MSVPMNEYRVYCPLLFKNRREAPRFNKPYVFLLLLGKFIRSSTYIFHDLSRSVLAPEVPNMYIAMDSEAFLFLLIPLFVCVEPT